MDSATWEINWECWSGEVWAKAHPAPPKGERIFGVAGTALISIWEVEFGTCAVLDTPENRAALEEAAKRRLGRNGLVWESSPLLWGTVPAHTCVRVP